MTTAATIKDVLTTARDREFGAYLVALDASGLRPELAEKGPFTIFIPTDAAFERFTSRQLNELDADSDALRRLIRYSIVRGALPRDALSRLDAVETLGGETLDVSASNGKVDVDGAAILDEIEASNGVVYVVDEMLIPPSLRPRFGKAESKIEIEETKLTKDLESFSKTIAEDAEKFAKDVERVVKKGSDKAVDALADGAKQAERDAKKFEEDLRRKTQEERLYSPTIELPDESVATAK